MRLVRISQFLFSLQPRGYDRQLTDCRLHTETTGEFGRTSKRDREVQMRSTKRLQGKRGRRGGGNLSQLEIKPDSLTGHVLPPEFSIWKKRNLETPSGRYFYHWYNNKRYQFETLSGPRVVNRSNI